MIVISFPMRCTVVQQFLEEKSKELARKNHITEEAKTTGEGKDDEMDSDNEDGLGRGTQMQRHLSRVRSSFSTRAIFSPLNVHDEVFTTDRHPLSVRRLRDWIVNEAANSQSSSTGKFHFPSLRDAVPAAWTDATTAVENLGKEKDKPYVLWNEAVTAFERHFHEVRGETLPDASAVLLRAMQHREAEGGVLLSLQNYFAPEQNDMIHLDPRWPIELVRRLTDHNLVVEKKRDLIEEDIEKFCDAEQPPIALDLVWEQYL